MDSAAPLPLQVPQPAASAQAAPPSAAPIVRPPELSIVIPVYNEVRNIKSLHEKLVPVLFRLNKRYEIIFVDDGSTDGTAEALSRLRSQSANIRVVELRRNFGKSSALREGFARASGAVVITLDGDLQDEPAEIPRFLKKLDEGFDVVSGWKFRRHDPLGKRLPSKVFNALTARLTGVRIHDFNCGFKAYRQEAAKSLNLFGDRHRYIPALAAWQGYRVGEIKVEHHPRRFGKSKYGSDRLLRGLFDLLTIKFLITFTKRPLHFFGKLGLACIIPGLLSGAYLVALRLLDYKIGDRPLLILSVLLTILGVQFISMGLLGEMITSDARQEDVVKRVQ